MINKVNDPIFIRKCVICGETIETINDKRLYEFIKDDPKLLKPYIHGCVCFHCYEQSDKHNKIHNYFKPKMEHIIKVLEKGYKNKACKYCQNWEARCKHYPFDPVIKKEKNDCRRKGRINFKPDKCNEYVFLWEMIIHYKYDSEFQNYLMKLQDRKIINTWFEKELERVRK